MGFIKIQNCQPRKPKIHSSPSLELGIVRGIRTCTLTVPDLPRVFDENEDEFQPKKIAKRHAATNLIGYREGVEFGLVGLELLICRETWE